MNNINILTIHIILYVSQIVSYLSYTDDTCLLFTDKLWEGVTICMNEVHKSNTK